jgi:hypothetical protein
MGLQDDQERTNLLQSALAEATQTDKRTVGVFINSRRVSSTKSLKTWAHFLARFWQAYEAEEESTHGLRMIG